MIEKYTKENGYYKFYNKNGKRCKIKCENIENEKVIISFSKNAGETMYHLPDKVFKNTTEVIYHLVKNLESDNVIFTIYKSSTIK